MYDYKKIDTLAPENRPEAKVGLLVSITGKSIDELMTVYEELLIGAFLLNRGSSTSLHGVETMIDWLRSTDFYRAPASTIYHESFVGGLLVHSLKVYNEAIRLTGSERFKDVSKASITLVALTHDWCKIDTYQPYQKNVKNEVTGQWEKEVAFKREYRGITLGHGTTSMFLASKFFRLSPEEALAIRWHQGRWNVCDAEVNEFQRANEIYPLVHLIQFADQLAITDYVNNAQD